MLAVYIWSDATITKCSMKQMMGPAPHTQLDAELAAGMGMPDNGPKLMSMWAAFFFKKKKK